MFFRVNGVAFKVEKNKGIASSKVSSMAKSKVECAILFSLGGIYWSAGYNEESMSCILSDVCPSGTENLTNSTTLIRITECGHCGYIYSTKANSCLKLVSTLGITWTGARTVCLNEGADLVSITTLEKMNVILNLINAELERKNIAFPINAKRLTLVRILKRYENSDSITSNTTNARGEEARGEDSHTRGEEPLNGSAVYHHALPQQNARVDGDPRSQDAPNINNNENTPSNDNRVLIGIVSKLSSTVQSLQQNVSGLTGKVNLLLQARNETTSISRIAETPNANVSAPVDSASNIINHTSTNSGQSWSNFNLQSAYNALQNTRTAPNAAAGSEEQLLNMGNSGNMVRTAHGYSAETLPFVETISPQLRKNIISGMDINLTSLLIPYYSGSGTHELSLSEDKNNKSDPRSSRSLSLGEFIQAFGFIRTLCVQHFLIVGVSWIFMNVIWLIWPPGIRVRDFTSTINGFLLMRQLI
ncbi:CD206 [Mytilus edulis]|uniref:MRC n=1 Tax=Mytilus edulis TaxID=6550 RepID=A0A8S3SWD3_MYTED|nr:CD206 [Mytilus edulis]